MLVIIFSASNAFPNGQKYINYSLSKRTPAHYVNGVSDESKESCTELTIAKRHIKTSKITASLDNLYRQFDREASSLETRSLSTTLTLSGAWRT